MLRDMSTRKKLLLLPIFFVIIVLVSALVYNYYNSKTKERADVAVQTNVLIQEVLKGRISVYQFLRASNEENAKKVRADFKALEKSVKKLQPKLIKKENIELSNEIIKLSKQYINHFNDFYNQKIKDFNKGIFYDGKETLAILDKMVKIGLLLEKDLDKITQLSHKKPSCFLVQTLSI